MRRGISWLANWNIEAGDVIPAGQIQRDREKNSRLSIDYLFRCVASAFLATLGLIGDSTVVVIAAMIIAPLMDPLLGLAVAISSGKSKSALKSFTSFLVGSVCVFLAAFFLSSFVHVNALGSEIFSRTSPSLIDLFVAIIGGSVAAFITTRSSISNAIAGVAIAVALVPPLCVAGIGLTLSPEINSMLGALQIPEIKFDITLGALLLYLCNFIGIVAAASVTYLSQSVGKWRRSILALAGLLFLSVLIIKPLASSYQKFMIKNHIRRELTRMGAERIQREDNASETPRSGTLKDTQFRAMNIKVQIHTEGKADVYISLNAPHGAFTKERAQIAGDRLSSVLDSLGVHESDIHFRVIPVTLYRYED